MTTDTMWRRWLSLARSSKQDPNFKCHSIRLQFFALYKGSTNWHWQPWCCCNTGGQTNEYVGQAGARTCLIISRNPSSGNWKNLETAPKGPRQHHSSSLSTAATQPISKPHPQQDKSQESQTSWRSGWTPKAQASKQHGPWHKPKILLQLQIDLSYGIVVICYKKSQLKIANWNEKWLQWTKWPGFVNHRKPKWPQSMNNEFAKKCENLVLLLGGGYVKKPFSDCYRGLASPKISPFMETLGVYKLWKPLSSYWGFPTYGNPIWLRIYPLVI